MNELLWSHSLSIVRRGVCARMHAKNSLLHFIRVFRPISLRISNCVVNFQYSFVLVISEITISWPQTTQTRRADHHWQQYYHLEHMRCVLPSNCIASGGGVILGIHCRFWRRCWNVRRGGGVARLLLHHTCFFAGPLFSCVLDLESSDDHCDGVVQWPVWPHY